MDVSGPFNHFELELELELEPAGQYLFVAGGIGITPIKAMIESLPERRDRGLIYVGRSRATMAFVSELVRRYGQRVYVFARDENTRDLDIGNLVRQTSAQVYCSGPESLMHDVAAVVPPDRMHFERFVPLVRVAAGGSLGHLDSVMEAGEKDRLHVMYPCVSRARTADLVLDL